MHSYLPLALAMMVTANLWLPSLRSQSIEPLRQTGRISPEGASSVYRCVFTPTLS